MAGEAVGFWSYVQQDNDGDHGRILALAHDLREQYRIQTAEPLHLFLDREDVGWGEAWKERIDTAIAGTTFFIPIITPSYLRSPECRRELLKFAREADRLGLGELVMSILWVRVPELEDNPEQSEDEAVRLVAKYNWEDLRAERLKDRDSSAYRKAVSALAEELADRARRARQVEDVPDALVGSSPAVAEDEGPGILDSLVATEEATPIAVGRLQDIGKKIEEINDLLNQASADLQAAAKRGQGMKAALTLTNRLAHEMSEPSAAINASGREYGQALGELDPGVHIQLDFIEEQGEERTAKDDQALDEMENLVGVARQGQKALEEMLDSAAPISNLSRSLRAPLAEMRAGLLGVIDGNAVIEEWGRRATEIKDGDGTEGDDEESTPAGD